jgi:hypothetical protein
LALDSIKRFSQFDGNLTQVSTCLPLLETKADVLISFYEWRVPSRTGFTVGLLGASLPILMFIPVHLIIRATTLGLGITFFLLFPISSRFPEYRLLASPVKWLFWKIPTHAEWSIKALQAEGLRNKESTAVRKGDKKTLSGAQIEHGGSDPLGFRGPPTTRDGQVREQEDIQIPEKDYGSYGGTFEKKNGALIISSSGVRFVTGLGGNTLWECPFRDMRKLEKVTRVIKQKISKGNGEDLKIVRAADPGTGLEGVHVKEAVEEYLITDLNERDQVFSQIVGYSEGEWQVVW